MPNNNNLNLTKKDLAKILKLKIGLSQSISSLMIEDILFILKKLIIKENLKIKNFGIFKISYKKERMGRNPKDKKPYLILARKSLSFTASKNLSNKFNN